MNRLLRFSLLTLAVVSFHAWAQNSLTVGDPGCTGEDREAADRKYFQLCHSSDLRVPLWVGYELTKADLDGPAERPSGFREDKDLKKPGSRDRDYEKSGYARGHMAPAEDFSRSAEAIHTTFLLSNIVPQRQGVNGGRWAQLELAVRNVVRETGRAYIFTGPLFSKPTVDTIGDDEVGVPTHTFKVVLAMGPGDAKKMYAVIMPNLETVTKPVNTYVTTVREVERRTGFNFFSALPKAEQSKLETAKALLPGPKTKKQPAGHK